MKLFHNMVECSVSTKIPKWLSVQPTTGDCVSKSPWIHTYDTAPLPCIPTDREVLRSQISMARHFRREIVSCASSWRTSGVSCFKLHSEIEVSANTTGSVIKKPKQHISRQIVQQSMTSFYLLALVHYCLCYEQSCSSLSLPQYFSQASRPSYSVCNKDWPHAMCGP